MRKLGYLKYKTSQVNQADKAEYEASRLKAYEASAGIKIEHREESKTPKMSTKMGMRKESSGRIDLKQVSPKHSKALRTYNAVRDRLLELCGGKSELSGIQGDNTISGRLSPHHITGRAGAKLTNPFNIIWLLEREHWVTQSEMSWENKLELLKFIKPIRIAQGFKEVDYEPLEWHYSYTQRRTQ